MELCLSRVSTCLEASGAKITDMTRLMYYITERAWEEDDVLKLVTDVVGKWLQGHRPASCFLVVKALSQPEYLCEFEAQAVVSR
jgi:enamine deaminase RidA (YjgF/YER057c/UK114 family)